MKALIVIDTSSVVKVWNKGAEDLFGYSEKQAVGHPLADLIIPREMRAIHYQGMNHFMNTGEGPIVGKRVELHAKHATGKMIDVSMIVSTFDLGQGLHFSASLHPITKP